MSKKYCRKALAWSMTAMASISFIAPPVGTESAVHALASVVSGIDGLFGGKSDAGSLSEPSEKGTSGTKVTGVGTEIPGTLKTERPKAGELDEANGKDTGIAVSADDTNAGTPEIKTLGTETTGLGTTGTESGGQEGENSTIRAELSNSEFVQVIIGEIAKAYEQVEGELELLDLSAKDELTEDELEGIILEAGWKAVQTAGQETESGLKAQNPGKETQAAGQGTESGLKAQNSGKEAQAAGQGTESGLKAQNSGKETKTAGQGTESGIKAQNLEKESNVKEKESGKESLDEKTGGETKESGKETESDTKTQESAPEDAGASQAVSIKNSQTAEELFYEKLDWSSIPEQLQVSYNPEFCMELSSEQKKVLETIVEAEAGDEDVFGKMLVAGVILNRVLDDQFPDTVKEVVFQNNGKTYQFSPVRKGGRYYTVKVSNHTKTAVARVLAGEDYSEGSLYFFARKYTSENKASWFDTSLKKIVKYGCHEFYKEK